jgi:hypothetical protein
MGEWDCGSAGATSRPFPYPFATRLNQEAIDGRKRRRWITSDLNAVMLVLAPNGPVEGFRSFANRRANGEVAPKPVILRLWRDTPSSNPERPFAAPHSRCTPQGRAEPPP